MKFTIKQFTEIDQVEPKVVAKINGEYEDLSNRLILIYYDNINEKAEHYPLASLIETIFENEALDNDLTNAQVAAQDWRLMTDQASKSIFHINSTLVFDDEDNQILTFDDKVYDAIQSECIRQCEIYFAEVIVEIPKIEAIIEIPKIEKVVEIPKIEIAVEIPKIKVRHVAKYPGIYPSPIKSNPGRFIANYRKDGRTIKIGFFDSEDEAHDAKEAIINPVQF